MDLTNDDVADILALLDSLPYDSLDVETPRFRLTLRRAPGGGWTQESQVLAEPVLVTRTSNGAPASSPAAPGASAASVRADKAAAAGHAAGTGEPAAAGDVAWPAAAERPAGPGTAAAGTDGLVAVAAPLPGTFYRAPRPGAEPFVRVGDEVTPETVVGIVETMKLMNSVHAGAAGQVARICADNGEFTPLGATLMLIGPAR